MGESVFFFLIIDPTFCDYLICSIIESLLLANLGFFRKRLKKKKMNNLPKQKQKKISEIQKC